MIKVKNARSGLSTVTLDGELTIYCVAELKEKFIAPMQKCKAMTINLAGIIDIDTACLQLLIQVKREFERAGKQLNLVSHSPAMLEAMDLFDLDGFFGDPLVLAAC